MTGWEAGRWRPFVRFTLPAVLGLAAVAAVEAAPVRAMTFNVRCPCGDQGQYAWSARKDLVVDVIRKYKADFVGTQENVAEYLPFLKDQLPDYASFGRGREANGGGEYVRLYYRQDRWEIAGKDSGTFQMSATPNVWGSKTWSSLPRITTWALFREKATGKLLYVYNAHWDHLTGRDEFSHMTADTLARRRLKGVPVLLMGDFNRRQDTSPIRYLLGQDVYPGRAPVMRLSDTHPATLKIDHVLAWPPSGTVDSLPMEVLAARVVGDRYTVGSWTNVSPSDHDPTLVELNVWKGDAVYVLAPPHRRLGHRLSEASYRIADGAAAFRTRALAAGAPSRTFVRVDGRRLVPALPIP